ncbi:hypothetical protein MMC13_000881 [Lambiella insularis]|nr:hypothetical protein [Lambiella insularis]
MSSHLCGCYYYLPEPTTSSLFASLSHPSHQPEYLPRILSEAETTILSTNSKTTLKQVFTNNTLHKIDECVYAFPLYDGVSVVKFTCHIGSRTLYGVVKEKTKARAVYNDAVAKGETAGLLEQYAEASDVFVTKLGNISPGEVIVVDIEYVGELKQDAETNGIRFTIPTRIAPRYGSVSNTIAASSTLSTAQGSGIKIAIHVRMPSGSFIQSIQSPSHPIAVSMDAPSPQASGMTVAHASLSLGETALDQDFVLIVLAKDTGVPKAFLETHPTIPNQRALMATLVPKFSLPPSRPEIVFVADRSGSMESNIPVLVSAIKVFLKSLPVGVKFNICSFGSENSFLWPKSKSYVQETLTEAITHVQTFSADMGGTQTFAAIKATIDQRFKDIPLEIMLLTDGDIWQQEQLFTYLNEEVEKSQGAIRVFPLGIGTGVSHALIEGVARAGNGFAQTVQNQEKLENRLVRMLKGALSPHVTDYTLEVKYETEKDEDDFEIVEVFDKVADSLKASLSEIETGESKKQAPISLFDTKMDVDEKEKPVSSEDRYTNLPKIATPKLIQAPHKIPPLFPFNRTSVYLLMSPGTAQKTPKSVILRGTSAQGPLELEIVIEVLAEPAATIHQLTAKKAVQDLEEGRGWLSDAKDDNGQLLRTRLPSQFDDLVEREAVRLGVQFQIAGKWCSFVAVAADDKEAGEKEGKEWEMVHQGKVDSESMQSNSRSSTLPKKRVRALAMDGSENEHDSPGTYKYSSMSSLVLKADRRFVTRTTATNPSPPPSELKHLRELAAVWQNSQAELQADRGALTGNIAATDSNAISGDMRHSGSLYGASSARLSSATYDVNPPVLRNFRHSAVRDTLFGASRATPTAQSASSSDGGLFGNINGAAFGASAATPAAPSVNSSDGGLFGNTNGAAFGASTATPAAYHSASLKSGAGLFSNTTGDSTAQGNFGALTPASFTTHYSTAMESAAALTPTQEDDLIDYSTASDADKVLRVIALQSFEGWWESNAQLMLLIGVSQADLGRGSAISTESMRTVQATMCVVVWLEEKMKSEEGVWELVVEKARAWVLEMVGDEGVRKWEMEARLVLRL